MPAKRITMRKIREVLRLRLAAGLSIRQIRESTKISVGAIQKLLRKADELGLVWPDDLDDSQLARLFYPAADTTASARYAQPDWAALHQELKRKGMTKQLLWEEYTQHYPNRCYSYLAKYRAAFFKISRSSSTQRSCARSRRISLLASTRSAACCIIVIGIIFFVYTK